MADTKKIRKIKLDTPIKVEGGEDISKITLTRPHVGQLRGLLLAQVQMQHVGALITLIPRIAQPPINEDQVAAMDPADFAEIANEVSGFFVKPGQLQKLLQEMG